MTIELIGPTFKPQDKIIESIVFFHGWGSNGDDLISLAPIMANVLSSTLFVSPNAPSHVLRTLLVGNGLILWKEKKV